MSQETHERILAYLVAHNTLTLATANANVPWATAVFFANDGFTLYFVSDPQTRHAGQLKQNSRVAGTIQDEQNDWRSIQGIRFEGDCEEITNPIELAQALTIYGTKFSFINEWLRSPTELSSAMTKARFHKIKLGRIRLIDNTRGFGFKDEIRF